MDTIATNATRPCSIIEVAYTDVGTADARMDTATSRWIEAARPSVIRVAEKNRATAGPLFVETAPPNTTQSAGAATECFNHKDDPSHYKLETASNAEPPHNRQHHHGILTPPFAMDRKS